ncbi:ankyrin repeat-containing domain protein [Ampelomyces quisqualis]|uniref:Ankyrin repeat-containing domain protein n=1 Tax=Ampelomyces quisqualis TaxID=50730 RepID=A0A6A5QU97_AMPQU|nr:ankyrin repeat-containing domain protein [Ampelomyces quisqualis]
MTKDWDAVQDEIRELSFNQKKRLEDVKELMERNYKFRASTRAYRMKLKEWGFKRHNTRNTAPRRETGRSKSTTLSQTDENEQNERDSSATVEPMPVEFQSIEPIEPVLVAVTAGAQPRDLQAEPGGWQVVSDLANAEPAFTGLLHQTPILDSVIDPLSLTRTIATDLVMNMLGAILENDSTKLEQLLMDNNDHINDPIGMPFETPSSDFFGHPVMKQMVIGQHPGQTLLDVACGMPCSPVIWVLFSFGAKGTRHPLGTDLALHNAIKNGRSYTVQALLSSGRSEVNGVPGTTWTPLLQTVFWNHPELVRIVIRKGANLEDRGLSPRGSGYQTALELCLYRRAACYSQDTVRDKCNQILKQLLEAGADIHVAPGKGRTASAFETFIQPWQTTPLWVTKLSTVELDCLRLFVCKGANLRSPFNGCYCRSVRRTTFEHQALWHSTPDVARLIIDSLPSNAMANATCLLHEILGSCPDVKRHPADTLRDIQVLLQRGADPNLGDSNGLASLRKCIEECPAVDLVGRLQMLVNAGADPEHEDREGIQPFVLAARTFEEPLLSEVMHALVGKMRGGYRRIVDGVTRTWSSKHFPINDTPTYEQVTSSAHSTGDFHLEARDMVPEDIRETFQRAYFSIVSKKFFDTMTCTAKARMLSSQDRDEIFWIAGMRRGIDLPEYRFDQELVMALLDPQPTLDMPAQSTETSSAIRLPTSNIAADLSHTMSPRRTPWQFNPNTTTTSPQPLAHASQPQSPEHSLDDMMVPATTLIRWHNPESSGKPGDTNKIVTFVLQFECDSCNDGILLTKKEQDRHTIEHAHSNACLDEACMKRFCAVKRRGKHHVGSQDHVFAA